MKKLFVVSALALAVAGCSSEYDFDKDKVQTQWSSEARADIYRDKDGEPITGTVVKRLGDKLLLSVQVKDGLVNGEYKQWNAEGGLKQELNFVDGKRVGQQKVYCPDGKALKEDRTYSADGVGTGKVFDCASGFVVYEGTVDRAMKPLGVEKRWQVLGDKQVPLSVISYSDSKAGELNGVSESYFKNIGVLESRTTFKDGKKDGDAENWAQFTDGTVKLKSKEKYSAGEQIEAIAYKHSGDWPDGSIATWEFYKGTGYDKKRLSLSFEEDYVSASSSGYFPVSPAEESLFKKLSSEDSSQKAMDEIDYLIKNTGADLNALRTYQGYPVIHVTSMNKREKLKSLGVDVNAKDGTGASFLGNCTDFHSGQFNCSIEDISVLIAEETPSADVFGNTPLINFCGMVARPNYRGNPEKTKEAFKQLIAKSDVNAANQRGRTALHECLRVADYSRRGEVRDLDYAQMLVDAGADLGKKDIHGLIPAQMLFIERFTSYGGMSVRSNEEILVAAQKFGMDSQNLKAPFPVFDKPLKEIFIDGGDAGTAMVIERFGG